MPIVLRRTARVLVVCSLTSLASPQPVVAQIATDSVWTAVGALLRATPAAQKGWVKYAFPRSDLTVQISGITLAPALISTSWLGFTTDTSDAVTMGDIVVTTAELPLLLRRLAAESIDVTAIHEHAAGESPRLLYVHVHAHGAPRVLAARFDRALGATHAPRPARAIMATRLTADTAMVFSALGLHGKGSGAAVTVSTSLVGDSLVTGGMTVPASLAAGTPINVQFVGSTRLLATGDFAFHADHTQALLQALAAHGITATAVHDHLLDESPRLTYVHFWADGKPAEVLAGLKAALDAAR